MKVTKKNLRSCSACVYEVSENGRPIFYVLKSYATLVAKIRVRQPEENGEKFTLTLYPQYDCSTTTMSHVRKFVEDICGYSATITEIRECLKTGKPIYTVRNIAVEKIHRESELQEKNYLHGLGISGCMW